MREAVDRSTLPELPKKELAILKRLLALLKDEAGRSSVPTDGVEVGYFVDPDDQSEEVVVTQWVNASPETALDYWDQLAAAIERWTNSLPNEAAKNIMARLAVEVRWREDG